MDLDESDKSFVNWEKFSKGVLVAFTTTVVSGLVFIIATVNLTTPLLKVTLGVVALVLVIMSGLGWKMLTAAFEPVIFPPPNHSVLLRAYTYDTRHSPFHAQRLEAPFTIPRPMISPDPYGPPCRLAPPPPTYDFSQNVANTTAPPPYSNNGILRRSASNSPPPQYNHREAINSPPPAPRSQRVVIDCSKAEPTLYTTPTNESVI